MERLTRLFAYGLAGAFVAFNAGLLVFTALRGWLEGAPVGLALFTLALGVAGLWAARLAARKFLLIWRNQEVRPERPHSVETSAAAMTALYLLLLFGPASLNFFLSRLMGYPVGMSLGGAFFLLVWGWVLLRQFQATTAWGYWLGLSVLYFLPAFLPLLLGWGGE